VGCDTGQQTAAVEESVSAVAAGDVLGSAGGDGASARLLEFLLEGEATDLPISAVDARDQRLCGLGEGFLELLLFDLILLQDPLT
jgi:hypothetical protein